VRAACSALTQTANNCRQRSFALLSLKSARHRKSGASLHFGVACTLEEEI
jgi:hypothetical protein